MLGSAGQKDETKTAMAWLEAASSPQATAARLKEIAEREAYAQQILADAKAQAAAIRDDAKADCAKMIAKAEEDADAVRDKATKDAGVILSDANDKAEAAALSKREVAEREKAVREREAGLDKAEAAAAAKTEQAANEQSEARAMVADIKRRLGAHAEVWAGV